ncbi:Ppx/GppA phosphatase family protein [Rhodovibrionaceae bacterium A322]
MSYLAYKRRRNRGSQRYRNVQQVFAALDLGTNNCRLLVAKPDFGGFRVIDAFSRIVRLGEGIGSTRRLSEGAMRRTIEALRVCAQKLERRSVTHMRAVATEACRRAENCGEFLQRVKVETGIELEIISTKEEAKLALSGCAPLLDQTIPNALVFDIGGGSTEVSWLDVSGISQIAGQRGLGENAIRVSHSMSLGVITLAERFGGKSLDDIDYGAMKAHVVENLAAFPQQPELDKITAAGQLQMLGTSGTVTTLAGVHKCLPRYDRSKIDGCYLGFDTVEDVSRQIASMSFAQRSSHPCIGKDRADLVVAGCAILEALCERWPVGRLRVADRGLREGILVSLMQRRHETEAVKFRYPHPVS